MRTIKFFLLGLLLASCSSGAVMTESGLLTGVPSEAEGITVYKGIPYAAPPVGDLRWKAPQKAEKWEGVRTCDDFGRAAMQFPSEEGSFYWHEYYTEGHAEFNEDCLTLNIWAPKAKRSQKYPVAVFFHGGAFQSGWSFEKEFDGDEWAKRGVILVTVNYRLGPFGFLCAPELIEETPAGAGNYGLMDQIASLEWVRDNIAAFGGDPDNVTIFGQSAGAISVQCLACSPKAKGLFHKAIIQSGGFTPDFLLGVMLQQLLSGTGALLKEALGASTLEEMRTIEASRVLEVGTTMPVMGKLPLRWWPTIDGAVNTKTFWQAVTDGTIADIPYMVGGTADDMLGLGKGMGEFAAARTLKSDQPVYTYRFDRVLPGEIQAGAFHSAELWYMFGTLQRSSRPFTDADYALSREMLDCWTSFAKTGDPGNGWNRWSEENPEELKIFDVE